MIVRQLKADASPAGLIRLSWRTPAAHGVRVLRHQRVYPVPGNANLGSEIFHKALQPLEEETVFDDGPLQGETVYYYSVVAYDAAGRTYAAHISASALTPYRTGDRLYRSLPEIHQILDRAAAGSRNSPDPTQGPLRRLMDIVGQPFDVLRSTISSMRNLHDLDRVDGALLPLLAHWIGQPSDTTLNLDQQRNEIRYAPQYHRTAGVPANLRAAINRYVSWDVRLKELVHNVLLTSHPEWLTLWEMKQQGGKWQPPRSVNLDFAFEGRIAPLHTADGRNWLIYHARRNSPAMTGRRIALQGKDDWHLFARIEDGEAQPSIRLTFGGDLHKHPAALAYDGAVWLFHARYEQSGSRVVPRIGLQVLSIGLAGLPAELVGVNSGPFALADGNVFDITVGSGAAAIRRTITLRAENLPGLASMDPAALAHYLNGELPEGLVSATEDGRIRLRSSQVGGDGRFEIHACAVAAALGMPTQEYVGQVATGARLIGTATEPFALSDGMTLMIRCDSRPPRTVQFQARRFANIASATAAEVVAAIERELPGVASEAGGRVILKSPVAGSASVVAVSCDRSSASPALGFGVAPPGIDGMDEDEPSAILDAMGNIWLFWASRRSGSWKIWYNCFANGAWAVPRALTSGQPNAPDHPDREPFALFDATGPGRLWVFWTRRNPDGFRNIRWCSTTVLDFDALTDADWTHAESAPAPTGYENREPTASITAGGQIELFFASNRSEGWNVWTKQIAPAAQGAETPVTLGQVTRRYPVPLVLPEGERRLYVRSNESRVYVSSLYPDATTIDARYSGSTSVDFNNPTKYSSRGNLEDMQRYTSDTRLETDPDQAEAEALAPATQGYRKGLFSRDVVGVYLHPDTEDQALVLRQRRLFADALRRLLPIQVRLAFLAGHTDAELIYTYTRPDIEPEVLIGEQMVDTILSEIVRQPVDSHEDILPFVRFLRTWSQGETTVLADLQATPPNLAARLYTKQPREGD